MERALAVNLGLGRAAIGLGLWLTPQYASKALGFDEPDERTLAVARIAASRDLVIAIWQLASLDDFDELTKASRAAAVCDAGDTVAFLLALRDTSTRKAGLRGVPVAAAAAIAGFWLASRR
jgi:hypothetical protein